MLGGARYYGWLPKAVNRRPARQVLARTCALVGVGLVMWLFALVGGADIVSASEEWRDIVFERDPGITYPHYEHCFWKVICVDFFVGDSGHKFHFPAKLRLSYNAEECYTGNDNFVLQFSIDPYDGAGLEYDMERGMKFEIDYTLGSWGHKYGDDFEVNFVPPLSPPTLEFSDVTATLFEKSARCLGGIALNLYSTEKFTGDEVCMTLRITNPAGGILVKFKDTDSDTTVLHLTDAGAAVSKALEITSGFGGNSIEISAEAPVFSIVQNESVLQPGVEIKVHKTALSCGFNQCDCWYSGEYILDWYSGNSTTRSIYFDQSESEQMTFEIANDPEGFQPDKEAQDAAADAERVGEENAPEPGSEDKIIAIIHNIYDEVCAWYDSIRIDYSLLMAEDPMVLGSHVIEFSDERLFNFNEGLLDTLVDTFVFHPSHPAYPFTKAFPWGDFDPHPCYQVTISPFASDWQCPTWTVDSRDFTAASNNVAVVSFERPLPDFSVDSVYVDAPSVLDFGDEVGCTVYVSNAGLSWPIAWSEPDPADTVTLTARVAYEQYVLNEDSLVILTQEIGEQVITPLDHDGQGTYYFEYELPDLDTLRALLPLKVRFLFEINDGATPVDWVVWEHSFENNRQDVVFWLADIPQLALPSGTLPSTDGEPVDTSLPPVLLSIPGPRYVYLFVSDESFSYAAPNLPPATLRVQMGAGQYESKPTDSTWTWIDGAFVRDYVDVAGRKYKVYRADAKLVQGGSSQPEDPGVHLIVDADGASMVESMVNMFYRDNEGVLKQDPAATDSLGYCFRASLRLPVSCCAMRGDVNNSGNINIGDLTYLVNFLFKGGPSPVCAEHGDVNGMGGVNVTDLTYLVNYLFRSGPPPTACG